MDALNLDVFDVKLLMVMGLFLIGAITLLVGIILLVTRSAGKEVRTLAAQTAKLAKQSDFYPGGTRPKRSHLILLPILAAFL